MGDARKQTKRRELAFALHNLEHSKAVRQEQKRDASAATQLSRTAFAPANVRNERGRSECPGVALEANPVRFNCVCCAYITFLFLPNCL